ncbi:acyltransferase [Leeuwenhoekiella sp. W20_SRS_FM14]|uniref:acyltransferase n=1 Tax=Leeuwenhoekiella sp. W20_SRS_FM14 TaxID=3240270 RepID=UPI003F945CB0
MSVNHESYVTKNTYLGKNVNFNGMTIQGGGKVTIGDNFHSGSNCQIITQNHNFNGGSAIPYDSTYVYKDVEIGDNVWLGNNVIILAGCRLGEGVIVQAGSVVVKNIPDYCIAGGHPAEVFSKRDVSHYIDLKNNQKFH